MSGIIGKEPFGKSGVIQKLVAQGNVGFGTDTPGQALHVKGTGTTYVQVDGASSGEFGYKFLEAGTVEGTIAYRADTSPERMEFYAGGEAGGDRKMVITDGGTIGIGNTGAGTSLVSMYHNRAAAYVATIQNDGDDNNRYGINIVCGNYDASSTNYAVRFDDGNGTDQGFITFSSGTVSYGAFTAVHDAQLPDADNENGYPYGTLVETTEIYYKRETERGIEYKVKKTSSAYSKAVLGAYSGKHSAEAGDEERFDNLHQINVLGDGHILCNGEKGNISIGDGICTSSAEGQGMKADKMAMIIGIAQEDVTFSGSESKLVAVQYGLQQFTPWTE